MKRILLAFTLLTATFTVATVQHATAQAVTAASFTTQVNQLDTYIGLGNLTMAQTTYDTLNVMMKSVLAATKMSIATAATPADKTTYTTLIHNQIAIYQSIWPLKADMVANRTALHTNLGNFDATIH